MGWRREEKRGRGGGGKEQRERKGKGEGGEGRGGEGRGGEGRKINMEDGGKKRVHKRWITPIRTKHGAIVISGSTSKSV